jgi:antitoxin component YwqK of YwqJK toxin-antitoxin module
MHVYKSAKNCIVTLELLNDSESNLDRCDVIDMNHAMFRCKKALVLNIEDKDTKNTLPMVSSDYTPAFNYIINEIVTVDDYDLDKNNVCSPGIHFYLTHETAYFHKKIVKNGYYKEWHPNGQFKEHCTYVDGKIEGDYEKWHPNGQFYVKCTYVDGKIKGEYRGWHSNGQLWEHCTYVDGRCDGDSNLWATLGNTHLC